MRVLVIELMLKENSETRPAKDFWSMRFNCNMIVVEKMLSTEVGTVRLPRYG